MDTSPRLQPAAETDQPQESHALASNALGLPQILFCILTGCAPLAAMLFNDPLAIYGAGWAAPALFVIGTVILVIFAIGYVQMAKRVTAAGGFYSFASHGFGQIVGLGVALTIAACYISFSAAEAGIAAYFANTTLHVWFGWSPAVWVLMFGMLAVIATLAHFHIELTAKILGTFLVIEVASLLVFGFASMFQAKSGLHPASLAPWNIFGHSNGAEAAFGPGVLGVGFFAAFSSWIGFEMAPNYAEEAREPKKTIGPATYVSVISMGILFTFVTWMLVVAWGAGNITHAVQQQYNGAIASVFYPQTERVLSGIAIGNASVLTRLFQLTIVTSAFAAQFAFFNTATRYVFSMGREGVLPRRLGRTHPSHHSPYAASTVVAALCALIMGIFVIEDPSTLGALLRLGTWPFVMGTIGILAIMALVSLAIVRYFLQRSGERITGGRWFSVVVFPIVAAIGIGFATYLLIANRTTFAGAEGVFFVDWLWLWPLLIFIGGVLLALWYRARDRRRYEGIGRYLHDDTAASTSPAPF